MTVFISSVKTKHRLSGTSPSLRFGQRIVFLRLCPRKVPYHSFSFCTVFATEACNNLAEPMEFDAFKGDWVDAFLNGVPTNRNIA